MGDEFKLTDKQISDAKDTFTLFDKKGDGFIQTKVLGNIFKSLGLNLKGEELEDVIDEIDEDGSGQVSWDQFFPRFEDQKRKAEDEKELREAFRVLDKHNSGVIPVGDLRWILSSLGDELTEEEIDDMIAETDTDGSGTVDYDEFASLMNG